MLTRRRFNSLLASGALASGLGGRAWAAPANPGERKFLFFFCSGGWDTTYIFTPVGPNGIADVEPDHAASTVNGITFVDVAARPNVRSFFERWGQDVCLINGLEVQSVAHERCRQLILTGRADADVDDWPSVLAAGSSNALVLPHIVMDGPAFNSRFPEKVVRVGDQGQLPHLLSADALSGLGGLSVPPASVESLEDAFLRQRVDGLRANAEPGASGRFLDDYARALGDYDQLISTTDVELGVSMLSCERDVVQDCATVFDCFELGLARCGMVRYNGWCGEGWDHHQRIDRQSVNVQDVFGYLDEVLTDLATRVSPSGNPLADEVTLVFFSEMGRAPRINGWGGKDHWTFTSLMLIGSGIQGGQVIGGVDDGLRGLRVDPDTGALTEQGVKLLPDHLGATLYTLADMDPGDWIDAPLPLTAALR
ncbi:MAG: DUF1501 domain-containing protein [Alphaproteobacteria bacterium]|nr:DUF1501 domain-containing protein [Alphaproteobacteria bacterium]